jgi:hypothetical protein
MTEAPLFISVHPSKFRNSRPQISARTLLFTFFTLTILTFGSTLVLLNNRNCLEPFRPNFMSLLFQSLLLETLVKWRKEV